MAQLWQVPLAFVAVTAVPLAQMIAQAVHLRLAFALLGAAVAGLFVFLYLLGVLRDAKQAVTNLQKIEHDLKLWSHSDSETEPTAKWTKNDYLPLLTLVAVFALGYFFSGLWLMCPLTPEATMNAVVFINPKWLVVAGLGMDIVGTILIVVQVIIAGREARTGQLDTAKWLRQMIAESYWAIAGLSALLIGFSLQIWGILCASS